MWARPGGLVQIFWFACVWPYEFNGASRVCLSFVRNAEGYAVAQYDVERGPEMDFMSNGGFRILLETLSVYAMHVPFENRLYLSKPASLSTET